MPITAGDDVLLPRDPSAVLHASTKQYVDAQVATRLTQAAADTRYLNASGDTMAGDLNFATYSLLNVWDTETKSISGLDGADLILGSHIAANGKTIWGLPTPTASDWAATKGYVDSRPSGITRSVSVISAGLTLPAVAQTDYVYVCTGLLTVTMPTAVGNKNLYTIKRTGTGAVTVATSASQTIDGATTFLLHVQYMAIDLVSDGTNWVVI